MYYSVPKLLSLLTFLFIFDYSSYSRKLRFIIDVAMIYFINKENSNITYNFTYLNKTNDQAQFKKLTVIII
jgi:hypothetical protein